MRNRILKIGIARFPYGGNGNISNESPHVANWLVRTIISIKEDPRCEDTVWMEEFSDTPITMTRNAALRAAQKAGVDVLLMIDSDMQPDIRLGIDPGALPFWDSAFEFLYTRQYDRGPCVIAAPYCGPPPHPRAGGMSNVYVFRWASLTNNRDEGMFKIDQFSREEAAIRTGIEHVAALPTGLCMLDLRLLNELDPPWFRYEWTDKYESDKASTEDVYFTRNCDLQGIPQFVDWDAWAGHVKQWVADKPNIVTVDEVCETYRRSIERKLHRDQRLCELNPEKTHAEIMAEAGTGQVAHVTEDELMELGLEGGRVTLRKYLEDHQLRLTPVENPREVIHLGHHMAECDAAVIQNLIRHEVARCNGEPIAIAEIGTWTGATALAMAECLGPSGGKIYCVDTFEGSPNDRTGEIADLMGGKTLLWECFMKNVENLLDEVIVPVEGESVETAAIWNIPLDVVFVDAGHTYHEVKRDVDGWLPHIKPGGLLCGHDYCDEFPEVIRFADENGCSHEGRVWWIRVPAMKESLCPS